VDFGAIPEIRLNTRIMELRSLVFQTMILTVFSIKAAGVLNKNERSNKQTG